jgi:hypothetical protein
MECPECNSTDVVVLHEDPIKCCDCGSVMNISYLVCDKCNYSFRTVNDKFLDGNFITEGSISEAIGEIFDILEEESDMFVDNSETGLMSDLIHPCVKCGSATTMYDGVCEYECLMCGFRWEALNNE